MKKTVFFGEIGEAERPIMKIRPYEGKQEEKTFVADTTLVDGVYVIDRRRNRCKYQGYDRRVSADRRGKADVDEYI
ncbi:hypothetical protein [Grimontia hollisae]|uniref:Uncharacterized protein n=1 Tax=Grimontia hollisae TaxID=673 RepID=A0A377J812_GRIHO|nr:hypothetical protein [Grimontia hollisae]STO98651.1 Uncharacterised protein [Grimontia hollisae]